MALLYSLIDTNPESGSSPHFIIVEDEIDASEPAQVAVRQAVEHIASILEDESVHLYGQHESDEDEPEHNADHYRHQAHDVLGHRFRLFRLGKEVD